MARTELAVAIGSILVVAGVVAIPVLAPSAPVAPVVIPHVLPTFTPVPTASAAADLVGTGCAAYTAQTPTGPGSIIGMSQVPVAVAAASNPMLTSFSSATSGKWITAVNLVATLDNAQFTVFAPVDSAFAKLPPEDVSALKLPTNSAKLTSLLDYHIVRGQLLPSGVDGTLTTLDGGTLAVAGSGDAITVNGARVVCGGIHTANATVYLIDTVLTPPTK